jgi:hypothetical protein
VSRPGRDAPLLPSYGGRSLDMVLPAVAHRLGLPGLGDPFDLPETPRYLVMLVDGLGSDLLEEHADLAPFLSRLATREPITCGVPSTTATSLTSLGTGLPPGRHGVTGFTSRIPGTNRRLNSLTWDDRIDPLEWQPHPTMLRRIHDAGVPVTVVNQARFAGSGLTAVSQHGVPFVGIENQWEQLDVCLDALEATDRAVVYTYEPRLDHVGHRQGCRSQEWRDTLVAVDADVRQLHEELPAGTTLVVTADHGMIDLPPDDRFDVADHPRLLDDVEVLAGEARLRHLHVRPGAMHDVARRWREAVGDRALVRTRDDGLEDWFGPLDAAVSERVGDVVVAALGDFGVFATRDFPSEIGMVGFHGSITGPEMRIPLLVATS